MIENVIILEEGLWPPDKVEVHRLTEKKHLVAIYLNDLEAIEEKWEKILAKNKDATPGPTIRLAGRHHLGDKMILEAIPSDYKTSQMLGWLGVAMVPVTEDGYIGLQGEVESVAATIGKGPRSPGCTPRDTKMIEHTIKEMKKEFNVDITEENLTIHGVIESRPPKSSLHHALVIKVKLPLTFKKLKESWEGAEDKWEGPLIPLKLDYVNKKAILEKGQNPKAINAQSKVILQIILRSEFNTEGEVKIS